MQIGKINYSNTQQNFGMAIKSNELVNKQLASRIKTSKELNIINEIISKQGENKLVDATLLCNGNKLCANVYETHTSPRSLPMKHISEGFWNTLFSDSPVAFFKKLDKSIEEMTDKVRGRVDSSEVLNKML